jgi:hypothetical protein
MRAGLARTEKSPMSAKLVVPVERIELPTFSLQNCCSTAELNRQTFRFRQSDRGLKSFGAFVPAIDIDGAGAPSNTRVAWSALQPRKSPESHVPSRPRMLISWRESDRLGEKRNDEQAVVDCICPIGVPCLRIDRSSRRGSGILQTIYLGSAQPGTWRIGQSSLRRRPARRALVVGFCGPLRMVSRRFLWRRRHRAGRPHAVFERLHGPMIT